MPVSPRPRRLPRDHDNNFAAHSGRGGSYDGGEEIVQPEGKTLTSKQLDEITAVVRERQAEMAAMLAEETVK